MLFSTELITFIAFSGKMVLVVDLSSSLYYNGPTAPSLNWPMKRFNDLAPPSLPGGLCCPPTSVPFAAMFAKVPQDIISGR